MGLTKQSVGLGAAQAAPEIKKRAPDDKVIALAGNPNVGKSTVFNALTGMKQHTGNWPGKTVTNAQGYFRGKSGGYVLVDIPGTYSLMAHSAEEEVARNFICFGGTDAVIVVCDATCLERNLNLVLQTMEISPRVLVCVNLMDEARRKGISIDIKKLEQRLGVPVVGTTARKKRSLDVLTAALDRLTESGGRQSPLKIVYPKAVEAAIARVEPEVRRICGERLNSRWLSLRLLDGDAALEREAAAYLGVSLGEPELRAAVSEARAQLMEQGINAEGMKDLTVSAIIGEAERLCRGVVTSRGEQYGALDRRLDRVLTSRGTGYPVMIALLAFTLWLTIAGANYPSRLLSNALLGLQDRLTELFAYLGAPDWLHGALVLGVYRTLAWVASVMLPPMAIFFPLFTLLEDAGYLPRVAYNLDKPLKKCHACGKQALTMCMGFGCNAAGVVGCRIIDSPRERLLAILTNNFVPCNGRFPTLIALLGMFFVGSAAGSSLLSAALLTAVILLGIFVTLTVTRLLSKTLLRGVPSSFTLELPPYRRPQIGKVIVRSIFDRTLFVLGRAAAVAAPAGLVIWLLANVGTGGVSLLSRCADFLDPAARLMGLDGVILLAFILGFPANEIVVPIIVMAYMAQGSLLEAGSLAQMRELFISHGWTPATAVSMMLFSVMHWPCSTTLLTIHKETGSLKWTALAAAIPTAIGALCCIAFTAVMRMLGVA